MLEITLTIGESGPVVKLSGECDMSVAGQLSDALDTQIADGAQHLSIDISELRFADSACIGAFVRAHRALQERGGTMELAFPRPAVAKALSLLGVDQALTVRTRTGAPAAGPRTELSLSMITGTCDGSCPDLG